jgi:hypothetical protein
MHLQKLYRLSAHDPFEGRKILHVLAGPLSFLRLSGPSKVFHGIEGQTSNHEEIPAVNASLHFHATNPREGPHKRHMLFNVVPEERLRVFRVPFINDQVRDTHFLTPFLPGSLLDS